MSECPRCGNSPARSTDDPFCAVCSIAIKVDFSRGLSALAVYLRRQAQFGQWLHRAREAGAVSVRRVPFYGTCAIVFGAWEATAMATRAIPTVTRTCRHVHGCPRYRLAARALILLWTAGLARHLLADGPA